MFALLAQPVENLFGERAARLADDDDAGALANRALDQSRDLLADGPAHRAAHEAEVHRGDESWKVAHAPATVDDGFGQSRRAPRLFEPLLVGLRVNEFE